MIDPTMTQEQPIDVHQYARAIRHALPQILVLAVITAMVVAAGSSVVLPAKTYTASTTILARDTLSSAQLTDSTTVTRRLATVNLLTRTTDVLTRAASKLNGMTVDELRADVHSTVDPTANVITVDATADTADSAAAIANRVADALITTETQIENEASKGTLSEALAQVQELRSAGATQAEIQAAESRLASLAANSVGSASGFQIVQAAEPPALPSSPPAWFSGAVAFFAIAVLGMMIVLAREQVAPRVSSSLGLDQVLSMPILASIPVVRRARGRDLQLLPQAARDAFYVLALAVRMKAQKSGTKVVFVVSAVHDEGRTTVAANLARALSMSGARVLAVSADLRSPKLHEWLGAPSSPGLTDVLVAARDMGSVLDVGEPGRRMPWVAPLERALRGAISAQSRKLHVLPSGLGVDNPTHLLVGDAVPNVFEALRAMHYDFVIVDTPPALAVPDLQALAPHADGLVVVARTHRLRLSQAVELGDLLDRFGKEGLGVAVIERTARRRFYPALAKVEKAPAGAETGEREVVELR